MIPAKNSSHCLIIASLTMSLLACSAPSEPDSSTAAANGAAGANESAPYAVLNSKSSVQYKDFDGDLSQEQINSWVQSHRNESGSENGFVRYVYLTPELRQNADTANFARVGIAKAINSVAPDADDIICPVDVSDGHGLVFAIDLQKYWGNQASQKWQIVANASVQQATGRTPTLNLRRFNSNAPVAADRFAYNMLHGGIYNRLIDTPGYASNLKRSLEVGQVTHRMGVNDAITYGARYAQRRALPDGRAYWESFDDFGGRIRTLPYLTNRRNNPVPRFRRDGMLSDFGTVASETWVHMKNGLPAWYIWGNANQRRVRAEQSFVRDPFNHRDRYLITGWCQFCHVAGVQAAPSDMAYAIDEGVFTGQAKTRAQEIWATNDELAKVYAKDRQLVRRALQKLTLCMSDGDKSFNQDLIYSSGREQVEPTWLLVSQIAGHQSKGSTNGLRRRPVLRNMTPPRGNFP